MQKQYGYDASGRLARVGSPSGDSTYTYDDRGLLVAAAGVGGTASMAYNERGLPTTRTDSSGTASFGWQPSRDQLATVTDSSGGTRSYAWNSFGQLSAESYGTALRQYGYDTAGRLSTDSLKDAGGASLAGFAYSYDVSSNVASKTVNLPGNSQSGIHTYEYDLAERLTKWTVNGVATPYQYDAAGNRIQAGTATYTYDARNRLQTGPNETYSYSSRGALRQSTKNGVATTFTVDAAGRTAQSVVAGQAPVNFQYDGLDRVLNRNGAAFTYSGIAMDPTSDGTTTFSRGPDGTPLWLTKAGATVAAGMDRHGDLAFTLNANLTVGSTSVYDPFGVPTVKTGPGTAIGFQADWTEPSTGNVWMGARWYTPGNASFTTRDTYAGNPATPVSLNRYTYGSNNPIRYSDPTGHWACGDDYCDDSQIATGDGTPWTAGSSSGAQTLTNSELWAQYQSTGYIPDDNPINTTTTIHETSDGSVVIWNPSSQVGGYLGADGSSMQITPEGGTGNATAISKIQEKVFVSDPSFASAAAGEGDYMLTSSKVKPKTSIAPTTTTTLPKGGDPRIVKILEDIMNSTGVDYTSYSNRVLVSDCPNPINKNDNPRTLGISCHQGLANPTDNPMPIYDKDGKKIGELPPHSFAVRADQVTAGVVVHEVIHLTGTVESDSTPVTVTGTNASGQSKTITPSDPSGVRPNGIPTSELATDCATLALGVSKGLNYKRKVDEAADKLKAGGYKVSSPACP